MTIHDIQWTLTALVVGSAVLVVVFDYFKSKF